MSGSRWARWAIAATLGWGLLQGCSGGGGDGGEAPAAGDPGAVAAPAIVQPLRDLSVVEGDSATFNVVASHATDFAWQVNGNTVPDVQVAALTLQATTPSLDGATVTVTARNAAGSVQSTARLSVRAKTGGAVAPLVQVVSGSGHSLALNAVGQVLAWGINGAGQLGDGSTQDRLAPVLVRDAAGLPLQGIQAVAVGTEVSFALTADGAMLTWGKNVAVPQPLAAADGTAVTGITALSSGIGHLVMLKADGTLLTLGAGSLRGNPRTLSDVPSQVVDGNGVPLGNVVAISAGFIHSLALTQGGKVFAWGSNLQNELGAAAVGNTSLFAVPVPRADGVPLDQVRAISAGARTSYALLIDGSVVAWGSQSAGALGNLKAVGNTAAPSAVVDAAGSPVIGLRTLQANGTSVLALDSNGCVLSWGNNNTFQLGLATADVQFRDHAAPVQADAAGTPLCGATGVSSGVQQNAYVTTADRPLLGWGRNNGRLGDGGTDPQRVPVAVTLP